MLTIRSRTRARRRAVITIALLTIFPLLFSFYINVGAQNPAASTHVQAIETGKFRLHKFEQPIGEESYEIRRDGDALVIQSSFKFTDRGRDVPLSATLRTRQDLTPTRFEIKGSVSRFSSIDTSVEINNRAATVREGKETRLTEVPERFFTISGYAPVTMQMMLVRYLASHNIKDSIRTLPGGDVTVEARGRDTIKVGDKEVELERYSVSGLIWGRESLWFDSSKQLVAAVTVDAEFDHFEAIREGYESALPLFVSRAAADGMAALAELANRISPERKGALAIAGATLIDGTGKAPIPDSVVIISGDRITASGPRSQIKIPQGATVVDARGQTLLPGLWDMHAHFEQVEWGPVYLAAGVTTVRDVGNEFEFITAVRDAIREGRGLGPRLLLAGVVDGDGPISLGVIRANTPEEGRAVVNRYKSAGFEQIKIYSSIKPEVLAAITAEAHRLGMTVTGHVPEGMNATQAVEAGMDQINHIQYLPRIMLPKGAGSQSGAAAALSVDLQSAEAQQAIRFLKEHGTVIDPTLSIEEWILHPADTPFASIEPGAAKLPRQLSGPINNTGVPPAAAPRARAILEKYLSIVGALHRAGIPIIAGTDQVVPGHSLRREIELYVKAGLTPLEAIQAATLVPARIMKLDREVGTIEVGKRADLILLSANPLEEISNIRKVRAVVTAGRMYECAQLWQSAGFEP